jgi:hypothetical protein
VGEVLTQVRRYDLGQRALDLALDVTRLAGDDHLAGWAVNTSCWLLIRETRLSTAAGLAVAAADRVFSSSDSSVIGVRASSVQSDRRAHKQGHESAPARLAVLSNGVWHLTVSMPPSSLSVPCRRTPRGRETGVAG